MALSASNTTRTVAEEAQIRGVNPGTAADTARATQAAERMAAQVDQGQVPAQRQGQRANAGQNQPRGGRTRRGRKGRRGTRRARVSRRR